MIKELICISCPLGCHLSVDTTNKEEFVVTGNRCKRGIEYGKTELTNPVRMIASTVRVKDGHINMVPVRTEKPIPKEKMFDCLKALKGVELNVPIHIGDIVVKDICQTGVNIIATRDILK